ncbi:hypothetical protein WJ35_16280 [Burkholderia ubonensis]|uniref:Uncharacterized protein n=1 Tax=Burkholderia ubonensis TaxID=101571 RepID=A0A1B4LHH5_9BURK|nr:hypothetical protein AK36_2463 [Burkholderia vietnamiensis LMG 10929]AOJ76651.1 hypothetical protein WJ35_16280 [Burkholderia ubonensis]AOK13739.1 hypothetical protein WK31_25735 [Burkholderia vietnamiensis]AVR17569.1 hypothetical protein A8H33_30760 [Burkholderia vietnamiensis]KVM54626.1 hypothetical protein WJ57_12560 [Burkholderia vietnamiensis]
MIDRNYAWSAAQQAKLVAISRSSVYYQPQPVGEADRIGHRQEGGIMQSFGYDAMRRLAHRSGWPARFDERKAVYLTPAPD